MIDPNSKPNSGTTVSYQRLGCFQSLMLATGKHYELCPACGLVLVVPEIYFWEGAELMSASQCPCGANWMSVIASLISL